MTPEISVVIPSHARRLRLRWLLNALEEQTLERGRWEVVVVHTYDDRETRDLFERHPLNDDGTLRHIQIPPGTGAPARQRNLGWRAAQAPLILFTDDDCRPDARWVQEMLAAAQRHPGAILQGRTRPDPFENRVYAAPHARSLYVEPVNAFAQTCNILYPRDVLERVGGFDENLPGPAGEDTDLAERAWAAGTPYAPAPEGLVYHAVESYSLPAMVRLNRKWGDIPYIVGRHPHLRRGFVLRVFWRPTHFRLVLALLGLALGRRGLPLVAPYVLFSLNRRGARKGAWLACAAELPGRVVIDAAEVVTLAEGSIRHRTFVL